MTLKFNWSIASDDENSRQSFISDCDSEMDFSPSYQYINDEYSIPIINKLSIQQNEPAMTRSRAKAMGKTITNHPQIVPKQERRTTIRNSFDSFTELATSFTNSILFSKQDLTKNQSLNSPTDGVNSLTNWLESCSLDESKLNKNCLWSNCETKNNCTRPILSSSPNFTSHFSPFPIKQTSPFFIQSSSTETLFGQQQEQLWSRFRFAASTLRNNLWIGQINSTPLISSDKHFSEQSPISSPPQTVPSLLTNTSSANEQFSSPLSKHHQMANSEDSITKEDIIIKQPSLPKIFFTLTIFAVGLVLGYILTNTFPPNLIHHWFFLIWETFIKTCTKYFHSLNAYSQIIVRYILSFT